MPHKHFFLFALLGSISFAALAHAQDADPAKAGSVGSVPTNNATATARPRSADIIAQIREEGTNHSQVMQTLSYLTDVIGPRLTGSPNLKRANEWTREKLASWGL